MPENTLKYYSEKINEHFDSSKTNIADIELSMLIEDENKLLDLGRKLSKNQFILSELPKLISKENVALSAWLVALLADEPEALKRCLEEQVESLTIEAQWEPIAAFSLISEQKRERVYKLLTTIFSGTDSEFNAYLCLFILCAQNNDAPWLKKAWCYLQPRFTITTVPSVQQLKLGWFKLKEYGPFEQMFDTAETVEKREEALYWLLLVGSPRAREQLNEYIFSGKVHSSRLFRFLPQGHVDELMKAYRAIENESVASKVIFVKGMNSVGDASLRSLFFKIASTSEGELLRAAHQSIMTFIPKATRVYQQAFLLDERFDTEEVIPCSSDVISFWKDVRGNVSSGVKYGENGVFDIEGMFSEMKCTPYREKLANLLLDLQVWTGTEYEFNPYAKLSEQINQCTVIQNQLNGASLQTC